jgi:hypothetical protein
MKKIIASPIFWVIVLSALPLWTLFTPGLPVTHDGMDHVARIANFYQSLKEGNIVPRWAANLNWGYGHPVLMFLYPLPEYAASLFHFTGLSLVDSTKWVFGLAYIVSAVTMFLWMNAAFGVQAGVIGSLLYAFAPYRFVDLHVRGALGEHVAFIFPPLILYFLRKRSVIGFSVSIAALILSHNALALMFLPVIGLYGLYLLIFEEKNKMLFIIHYSLLIILGFGLSAFFWMPALLEGKFTLRDIVTAGEMLTRFVSWNWFIYSPWNWGWGQEFSKSLGFAQWIGIICAIILLMKMKEKKMTILIVSTLALLLFSLFIMTSWSVSIWRAVNILQNFQFPWRFLSLSAFLAAVVGGISLRHSGKLFIILYSLFIILVTFTMWHPKGYQLRDESYYAGIYPGTTDTGESSPIWSVRFMEHAAAAPLEVIDGDASVIVGKRTTTEHNYTITARKSTLMMENTLYFPGWVIYINGLPTPIEWQNPDYRGLMTFRVPTGDIRARVVFEDTKVRKTANMISVVSIALLIFLWRKRT